MFTLGKLCNYSDSFTTPFSDSQSAWHAQNFLQKASDISNAKYHHNLAINLWTGVSSWAKGSWLQTGHQLMRDQHQTSALTRCLKPGPFGYCLMGNVNPRLVTMSANIEHYGNKCAVDVRKQWKQSIIRRCVPSRINVERKLNYAEKADRGVLSQGQGMLLGHQVSCQPPWSITVSQMPGIFWPMCELR